MFGLKKKLHLLPSPSLVSVLVVYLLFANETISILLEGQRGWILWGKVPARQLKSFLFSFIYLFILAAVHGVARSWTRLGDWTTTGLCLVGAGGDYSLLQCLVFLLRWLLLLQRMGSKEPAQQLWCMGLVLHGTWGLPGPGIKLKSNALTGGFFNHWITPEALTEILTHHDCLWWEPSFDACSIWGHARN